MCSGAWPYRLDVVPGKTDRVQLFDVKWVKTTGWAAPLLAVLWSRDALAVSLDGGIAHFELALLDASYSVFSRSSFETAPSGERTLDGVGAELALEHGLLHARVAFGCAAKYGERFDVAVVLGGPTPCAATARPSQGDSGPHLEERAACRPAPVAPGAARSLPDYEDTQGHWGAWSVMPYVPGDVASIDADWRRVALSLVPPRPEPPGSNGMATPLDPAAVGSLEHTTSRWSYVKGDQLRLHQLLAIVDGGGREGFLGMYATASPRDLLLRRETIWHVALLTPAYEVVRHVVLHAQPPQHVAYRALQTGLTVVAGQPVARVRYLERVPEPGTTGVAASDDWELEARLSLDLEQNCLARTTAGH
jgi:hypothetical protein